MENGLCLKCGRPLFVGPDGESVNRHNDLATPTEEGKEFLSLMKRRTHHRTSDAYELHISIVMSAHGPDSEALKLVVKVLNEIALTVLPPRLVEATVSREGTWDNPEGSNIPLEIPRHLIEPHR